MRKLLRSQNRKLSFHLAHIRILVSTECGKIRNDCFYANASNIYKVQKDYTEQFSKRTGIEIQSQHWGVNRKISMKGIAVEYFLSLIDPCF